MRYTEKIENRRHKSNPIKIIHKLTTAQIVRLIKKKHKIQLYARRHILDAKAQII